MKTFRKLIPGDKIFVVNMSETPKVNEYNCKITPSNIRDFELNKIEKNGEQFLFSEISINKSSLDKTSVSIISKDRYNDKLIWNLYFSDDQKLNEAKREIALLMLKEVDKDLENYKLSCESRKSKIRMAYWDELNKN